jgi:divalent metal cation (Fe/Co/Zn/Cd) transporter
MALVGLGLNLAFDWWWADPVAALGITVFLVREARESWNGDDCC